MRDLVFGDIAAATKDVDVVSEHSINFGASDARLSDPSLTMGNQHDLNVVFSLESDLAAIDQVIPFIEDSANGSDWAKVLTGPTCPAGTKKGVFSVLPMPRKHRQHLRAGVTPKSSGTFTARTVNAWLEPGAQA